METACLRIKFTPLLQDIQKEDSRHCLEIVPEITCIQNLDKIQWTKEENSIEYTIPMTYTIILRKKHVIKDVKEEVLDKTYHSCVDLLIPSSDTNLMTLGSGDINRIVSDTFVLSKVTTDVEKCSIVLKEASISNNNESVEVMTAQVQTEGKGGSFFSDQLENNEITRATNRILQETAVTQTSSEVIQNESRVIQVPNASFVDYIKESIDKITNTEISSSIEVKTTTFEEVDQVTSSKTETRRNLSLTPICSINTEDHQEETIRILSNTLLYLRYEIQKEISTSEIEPKTIKSDDMYFSLYKRNNRMCMTSKQFNCVTSHRVNPEVRVANFVQIMEKEIMPLKLMLNDILHKCSSLGFSWKKSQKPIIYKNVPPREKQIISRCLKTKKQSNSNRVVYSIVFDG